VTSKREVRRVLHRDPCAQVLIVLIFQNLQCFRSVSYFLEWLETSSSRNRMKSVEELRHSTHSRSLNNQLPVICCHYRRVNARSISVKPNQSNHTFCTTTNSVSISMVVQVLTFHSGKLFIPGPFCHTFGERTDGMIKGIAFTIEHLTLTKVRSKVCHENMAWIF